MVAGSTLDTLTASTVIGGPYFVRIIWYQEAGSAATEWRGGRGRQRWGQKWSDAGGPYVVRTV
jgi:hypothetical protein